MRIINLIIMLVSLIVIAAFAFEVWRVLRGQRRFTFWFALSAIIFPLFAGATFVMAYRAKPIPVGGLWGFLGFNVLILFLLLRKSFTKPNTDDDDQILRGSALVSGNDMMTTLYGKKIVKQVKKAPHRAQFITLGEVTLPYGMGFRRTTPSCKKIALRQLTGTACIYTASEDNYIKNW